MPNRPNTPLSRNLRSNTQTELTFCNIKSLIDASKDEIINSLRAELHSLRESISSLSIRVDKLEEENKSQREALNLVNNDPSSLNTTCSEMMNEIQQRERRKRNLIIYGAPEATTGAVEERKAADKLLCSEIFEAIGSPDCSFKDISRIGKLRSDKGRLLRVTLVNEGDKHRLISRSKLLRNIAKFKNTFIKSDLTHLQRKIDYELRKELQAKKAANPDKDFIIHRGKITERSSVSGFRDVF